MRALACGAALLAASAAADAAPVRVVRAALGSKGAVHGSRFILEDPRATFAAGVDRQVIAHFEWEGAPGVHDCVATWKDPTGASVLISPYRQRSASPRFSVYWTLTLPDAPATGLWAVEAQVDGEPAGTLTFQVQKDASTKATAKRPLTPEEMYARANASAVAVEALDAAGRSIRRALGFLLGEGRVATAFQAVEGASRLRLSGPNGPAVETDRLTDWSRRQDWAVIAAPGLSAMGLAIDRARGWRVGDRCFFLEIGADGVRVVAETTIAGAQDFPGRGPRIVLGRALGGFAAGGPLLDEYGAAIGVLGGTLTPGIDDGPLVSATAMAVPTLVLPETAGAGATLFALAARGVFPPPLVGPRNVLTGTIARAVEKQNGIPVAVDEKSEFRRSERQAVAFLTWDPQERRSGMAGFRIHDEDNTVVMEGRPQKLSLEPRRYLVTTWPFPLATLKPGTYRIDFLIDADPVWRSSFRVIE